MSRRSRYLPIAALLALGLIGVRPAAAATPGQVGNIACASQPSVAADFDGDGAKDLAVGAPGDAHEKTEIDGSVSSSRPRAGSINIVYGRRAAAGRSGGLQPGNGPASAPRFLSQDTPGVVEDASAGDAFGAALAAGDFNGDRRPDLAVGIPGEDSNAGGVQVFYNGGAAAPGVRVGVPGSATYNQLIRLGSRLGGVVVGGSRHAGDLMGWALATGDFNADAYSDLAVGIPGYDYGTRDDAGAVLVLFGGPRGLTAAGQRGLAQAGGVDAAPERGDFFGAALATGDFNASTPTVNPRADDLAVGAPGEDIGRAADAGAVTVLYGAGSSGGAFFTANSRDVPVGPAATSDRFGCSLAAANFDHDAANDSDLAIGVPGRDVGAAADGGAAITIYNSRGLTTGAAPEDCSTPVDPPPGTTGVVSNNTISSTTKPRLTSNDCWIDSQRWTENAGGLPGVAKRGDQFGASMLASDLNDDGAAELVIGAPNETLYNKAAAGSVRVLFGFDKFGLTDSGGRAFAQRPSDRCTADAAELIGLCAPSPDYEKVGMTVETGDRFGQTIAAGDFNGDGALDVAVGVPGEGIGPAINYLFEEVAGYPGDDDLADGDTEIGAGVVQVIYGSRARNGAVTLAGGGRDVIYRAQGGLRTLIDALAASPLGESDGLGVTSGSGIGNRGVQAADGGPTTSGTVAGDHFGGAVG